MTSERKKQILTFLKTEIIKAKENAEKTDKASHFLVTGPSQSGDKYHSEKAADLAKGYLTNLENLKKEIESAKEGISEFAEPVCWVEVEFSDSTTMQFVFVNKAVSMTNYLFLSKDSPLGTSMLQKKQGDSFNYKINEDGGTSEVKGKILTIE